MPTLTAVRGESKKKEAAALVDFSAIWEVPRSGLVLDEGKGVYRYIGSGDTEGGAIGQLCTRQRLDSQDGPSSIEITILDTGTRSGIVIGLCSKTYPTELTLGTRDTSVAVHTAEEGTLLHFPHDPRPLGVTCTRGCVLRCSLAPNPLDNACRLAEFFKDGERVGVVSVGVPEDGLYGVVEMRSPGERILISPPVLTRRSEFDQIWEVCTPHIRHERDGLCHYVGPGYTNEESIGTVRTRQRIDPFGPLSSRSFEIRIADPGENTYIAVGICSRSYPHHMLPGWKETSVGYHADNGCLFDSSENGEGTGQTCKMGDTMRCTVQPTADGSRKEVSVIFHCNGHVVGKRVVWMPEDGFYGVFGMMSRRECVQVSLPEILEPYVIPRASFLSVWEATTPCLQYREDGVFAYVGEGGPDSIGTVCSKFPLDPVGPNNWFEVKIVDPGERCYIVLGVCGPRFPATQLPGWSENSVGFHADNSLILNGVGNEQVETRCNCLKGDVLRCTLDPVDGSLKQLHVMFHRNGVFVGKTMLWNSKEGFHAQVGSMSRGEVVQIASPQTTPSSLSHNAPPRSMSFPAVQSSKEAVKRKQMSTQDYSRMTPAIRAGDQSEPFSEGIHRVQTVPLLPHQRHSHGTGGTSGQVHTHSIMQGPPHHLHQYRETSAENLALQFLRPSHLTQGAEAVQRSHTGPVHHQEHKQQSSGEPSQHQQLQVNVHQSPPPQPPPISERSVPHPHLVPFDHVTTASPFPLDEHPLAKRGTDGGGLQLKYSTHDPHYASQVSAASAASDSDIQYQSQLSSGGVSANGRQRAASGSHLRHRTPPPGSPGGWLRAQTQPVTHGPRYTTPPPPPPSGASPAAKPPFSGFDTGPGLHRSTGSVEHIFKPSFDESDSPPQNSLKRSPRHKVLESQHEPGKEVEVCAFSGPRLYTKKENSFCRILHNSSCTEDGATLHCTLPDSSSEICFVMRRLQLTEKMPYFEVELVEQKATEEVVVGIVPRDHPHSEPMGSLPCTAAYNMCTGSLATSGEESSSLAKTCAAGDVVGCRVDWTYKLEAYDSKKDSLVGVEWFLNGCSIARKTISVPSSGFYPAIEMKRGGTVVIVRHSMSLKPDSYFTSHPLAEGFKNIDVPSKTTGTWKCVQNAEIDDVTGYLTPQDLDKVSLPTVAQSHTPFTTVQPYFEVELQHPISSYSILSVGALEAESGSEQCIPGEAPSSIALFPLLGFVMCNGQISTTLPLSIEQETKVSSEKLKIGVGVDFHQSVPQHSLTAAKRVAMFFTVNHQLINSTYVTIPPAGFYPTVAVGVDAGEGRGHLLQLRFSDPWPQAPGLPLGFARAPQKTFEVDRLRSSVAEKSLPKGRDTPQALQAALPLSRSHTYFEMKILKCHESHVFSCGLAPHGFSLATHPGDLRDSIGFFSSYGSVHHSGKTLVVCSPFNYRGAIMGCGARFPDDGSSKYMEVFFTLNRSMVARKIIENREPGLFPTVGFCTEGGGVASVDLYAEDPFPRLEFSTTWRDVRSMTSDGAFLQPTSTSETCAAQLSHSVPLDRPVYFTIRKAAVDTSARVLIGFTNSATCPLLNDGQLVHPKGSSDAAKDGETMEEGWVGALVDVTRGQALVGDSNTFYIKPYRSELKDLYGCGVEPIDDGKSHIFFFTSNNQVVFCKNFPNLERETLFPTIFTRGSTARLCVDACALWPLQTAIGGGWARVNHLFLENSKIRHVAARETPLKVPVGFAQASMPVTPSSSYFEVEVCSRSVEKAIAVGLAPRSYPDNTWVGWKPISIAYHLDDGCLFTGDGLKGHNIGPRIFPGQVVGCGFNTLPGTSSEGDKDAKVEVFFTINGALIVEQKISLPIGGFYPTICLESPTESVVFHRYPHFPPVRHLVGPDWGNCYSLHQTGMLLEHSFKHKETLAKGVPRGFCQASRPFSPTRTYFEVKIVHSTWASVIQVGVAVRLPVGCRSPSTDSVMYYSNGQVLLRSGGHKSTLQTEKCAVGDVVGCGLEYTDGEPSAVQFYLNKMKVERLTLQDKWRKEPLFPTIVLCNPGNSVLPRLNLSPPEWDRSSLIGWLRTERVQVKGNIASYLPSSTGKNPDVGLCQLSQCLEKELSSSFEVEILDRGKNCCIAVGAASTSYPAVNQPGWKENSVAYHGDDGRLFNNDPYGVSFGPPWRDRDVIGVGVREPAYQSPQEAETQVYFVKNGIELGHTTAAVPPSGLFPTIGFHSPGEKVKITLSSGYLGNFNRALLKWRGVCGMKLSPTSQDNQFVLQYLENGRRTPLTGIKPALAIYGEPFSEKLQYFELDLLSVEPSSAAAIGVVPRSYSLELAPGWGKESLGYHSDNGQLYQARDRGKYFGPIAKKGDMVGCGISFATSNQSQCSVFFTYNGVEIGRVRSGVPAGGFYPCVCLMQQHDKVRVTLSETFKPKLSTLELHLVGLMRISNCSYSDQIVQFSGSGGQGSTAPGFAQFALPMHKEHNYFAAHVLKAEDTVVIGLAVRDYPLRYLPGSTSVSMAYDVTKGTIRAVYDSDNFHRFDGPELVCSVGDRVGCGVVSTDSKSQPGFVYFTRNGVVVRRIELVDLFEDLYPVVGFAASKRASLLFLDWRRPLFDSPNLLCDC